MNQGADGKLFFGDKEIGKVTEWSADIIAPPVFYFEGKPFEMNAAGIYVPVFTIPFAVKPQHFDWSETTFTAASEGMEKLKYADILAAVEKMKAATEKHVFTSLFTPDGLWKPLTESSIGKNHAKMLDTGKLFGSYKTIPIPDCKPISIHTMFEHVVVPPEQPSYMDAIEAYKANIQSLYGIPIKIIGTPIYGPSPLAGLLQHIFGSSRRPFTIDHDDSHLFTREPTKKCTDAFDEQCVLRGIHGGGEYVWSEALQAHVHLA